MLRRRNVLRLLLPICACLLFCGCTPFRAVGDLLSPPQFSAENAALRKAFEAQVGKTAQCKSPVSGENLSAFLLKDFDLDGVQDALVFYAPGSLDETVHIGVFVQTDGEWVLAQDIENGGSEVYSAETIDMDADGLTELILCSEMSDGSRSMSIYTGAAHPFSLIKLSENGYAAMRYTDLYADGKTEIFTVSLSPQSGGRTAQARLLQKTQSGISVLAKHQLDGRVTGYGDSFYCPTETGGVFYLDAFRAESEMFTEVVVWNDAGASMSAPLSDSATHSNTQTVRHARIASRDLDGDGIPEIPCQTSTFENGEIVQNGVSVSAKPYLTQWCDFRDGTLVPVRQSLVHTGGRYMFCIPQDWIGRFSVVQFPEKQQWDFYGVDPQTGERTDYLFSALFRTRAQWAEARDKLADYTPLLTEGEDMLLVYAINTESALRLSEDMLKDAFALWR